MFNPEKYTPPKFDREPFISFPDVTTEKPGTATSRRIFTRLRYIPNISR